MNCACCLSCNVQNKDNTPSMFVEQTRAGELEKNVWALIFQKLDFHEQITASLVCKRWRYILSSGLIKSSNYKIGSFGCFKDFYKDFLTSRHVIILDSSSSMRSKSERVSEVTSNLLNFLQPVISARGIFVGDSAQSTNIEYAKTKAQAITYINNIRIGGGGGNDFEAFSISVLVKLSSLKSKLNTHIHFISDMDLPYDDAFTFNNYQCAAFLGKAIFHFYTVSFKAKFITALTKDYELRKDEVINKKRKLKDQLEINVHTIFWDYNKYSNSYSSYYNINPN